MTAAHEATVLELQDVADERRSRADPLAASHAAASGPERARLARELDAALQAARAAEAAAWAAARAEQAA